MRFVFFGTFARNLEEMHALERKSGAFFAKNPTLKSRNCFFKGLSLEDM